MGKGKLPDYDDAEKIITGLVEFDDEKCTRCGICASLCPGRAIMVPPKVEGEKRGLPYLNEIAPNISPCMSCGDCSAACPNKAITIKRGFRVKEPYRYCRLTQSTPFTFPKKY
jgi:ferredoxin